jgi:hypothetical protein
MAEARWFTVMDVFRDLRFEPEPRISWAVGAEVRQRYEERYGELPRKVLRPKTSGAGSHCFALYPPEMRPVVETIVREHNPDNSAQGDLF